MTMKPGPEIPRVASLRTVQRFQQHLQSLGLTIPCDQELAVGAASPLAQPLNASWLQDWQSGGDSSHGGMGRHRRRQSQREYRCDGGGGLVKAEPS